MQPDPHDVLGVPRGATAEEVRRAYLEKAKRLHPDRSTAPDAQQAFQRLQQAYQAISSGSASSGPSASAPRAGPHSRAEQWAAQQAQWARGARHEEWDPYRQSRPHAPPPPPFWELIQQRRIWIRGGLVHRMVHSLVATCLPLLAMCVLPCLCPLVHDLITRSEMASAAQIPFSAEPRHARKVYPVDVHELSAKLVG
ncbi:unnamed protein product [Prorocentrum cordatum]|uniref:J domain-containing protein n=1 Tax=Prorocentrum cordatum TaxID=2364126 RepID=A0ABN9PR51_9DINO|nr:unnamed protein product [Polarella glacialis]